MTKRRKVLAGNPRQAQKGSALITAIGGALLVSITAAAVINVAWRRFELSAMRRDRAVTLAVAESGFQYVFARLDTDTTFRTRINQRRTSVIPLLPDIPPEQFTGPRAAAATYIVGCHRNEAGAPLSGLANGQNDGARERDDRMHMYTEGPPYSPNNGKHVLVRVKFMILQDTPPPGRTHVMRSEAPKRQ